MVHRNGSLNGDAGHFGRPVVNPATQTDVLTACKAISEHLGKRITGLAETADGKFVHVKALQDLMRDASHAYEAKMLMWQKTMEETYERKLMEREQQHVKQLEERDAKHADQLEAIRKEYEGKHLEQLNYIKALAEDRGEFLKQVHEATLARMEELLRLLPQPIVNVASPEVTAPAVNVTLPELVVPAPVLHVQPVEAPVVNVEAAPQRLVKKTFHYFEDGRPKFVTEEEM